jgi:hypothetical protein
MPFDADDSMFNPPASGRLSQYAMDVPILAAQPYHEQALLSAEAWVCSDITI